MPDTWLHVRPYCAEHLREIGVRLKQFVEAGWLQENGHGWGTRYCWPSRVSADLFGAGNGRAPDSEHSAAGSEQIEPGSEHLGSEQLERLKTLADLMRGKAKVSKVLEMSNPFSLRIFVADGDPDGLRVSSARIFLRHLQCAIRAMYTKVISPFDKPAQAKR